MPNNTTDITSTINLSRDISQYKKTIALQDDYISRHLPINLYDTQRYSWSDYFQSYDGYNYKLYRLSIQYKSTCPYFMKARCFSQFDVLYEKYLLTLLFGRNLNRLKNQTSLPITAVFLDEYRSRKSLWNLEDPLADRYDIHAIIAAPYDNCSTLEALLGRDTLDLQNRWCRTIRTCSLTKATSRLLQHAAKLLDTHGDYALYGPEMVEMTGDGYDSAFRHYEACLSSQSKSRYYALNGGTSEPEGARAR